MTGEWLIRVMEMVGSSPLFSTSQGLGILGGYCIIARDLGPKKEFSRVFDSRLRWRGEVVGLLCCHHTKNQKIYINKGVLMVKGCLTT